MKEMLASHSPMYANTLIHEIKFIPEKQIYFVTLDGEGRNYCMNKGGDHNKRAAYMQVSKSRDGKKHFESFMKCFCRCEVVRSANQTCAKYGSTGKRLSDAHTKLLFKGQSSDPKDRLDMIAAQLKQYHSQR